MKLFHLGMAHPFKVLSPHRLESYGNDRTPTMRSFYHGRLSNAHFLPWCMSNTHIHTLMHITYTNPHMQAHRHITHTFHSTLDSSHRTIGNFSLETISDTSLYRANMLP